MCKSLDMAILNGRKTGDLFGKNTSFNWNGKAVVDYAIVPTDLFDNISLFKVGNYVPFLSDHCPIFFEVKTSGQINTAQESGLLESPKAFYLSPQDQANLIETLKLPEAADKISDMLENEHLDPQSLATGITSTLLEACNTAQIKPRKMNTKSSADHPWFDKDCQTLKNSIKKNCKKLRLNKSDCSLQRVICTENKKLKKLVKKKKNEYKLKIIDEMNLKGKQQKCFWRLLDKLDGTRHENIFRDCISGTRWQEHFKNVLRDEDRNIVYPPDSDDHGPLDGQITGGELSEASYVLRPHKSSGSDSLSNEMIKCLVETSPGVILKLFNLVFASNAKINQWTLAIITPIHKSGPKMDPNNYRGISILSCLGKLYSAILNKRLLKYAIEKNILKSEALGFVSGNRTSDAHLILHSLIQRHCHQKNEKIFSCFVDFSKAFDTIPRDLLLKKIFDYGVTGKFFNNIKSLYANDNCCIKVGNKTTEPFLANQGVKQGCILSPLLFNIFIADIVDRFKKENCRALNINDAQKLSCLLWADDLVLLSRSEEGLRNMLSELSNYADENHMAVNAKKTQCMIFNKTGKFIRRSYPMGETTVKTTNSYKYLGFIFTPSGSILPGLNDLKDRAQRAYQKLKNKMGAFFRLHPITTLSLFDSLIKPIMLYGSDFWGCLKMPKNNPIENLFTKFIKTLLGVQKQTSNIGALLELGAVPVMFFGIKNCIKNWHRINNEKEANRILLDIHQMAIDNNLPWPVQIKNKLDSIDIDVGTEDDLGRIHITVFERLRNNFHQSCFEEINSEHSKLRTYAKLKTEIGMEKYLNSIKNITERTAITKIRLSNHDLMIETGRYKEIPVQERLCPFCDNNVETEQHFLLVCKTYQTHREQLFNELRMINQNLEILNEEEQFVSLLNEPNTIKLVGNFLSKMLTLRRFLLNKHKQNM